MEENLSLSSLEVQENHNQDFLYYTDDKFKDLEEPIDDDQSKEATYFEKGSKIISCCNDPYPEKKIYNELSTTRSKSNKVSIIDVSSMLVNLPTVGFDSLPNNQKNSYMQPIIKWQGKSKILK